MADVTISGLSQGTPDKNSAIIPYSDGTTTLRTTPSGIVAASPGSVIQVVQTVKPEVDRYISPYNTWIQINNFSATITPKSISNKVLVDINLAAVSTGSGAQPARLYRDSTPIALSNQYGNNRSRASFSIIPNGANDVPSNILKFLDSPNTTSPVTYSVYVRLFDGSTGGGVGNVYINVSINGWGSGFDASSQGTYISTLTLTEIAG